MQRDFKALKAYVHRMITAARLTKGCRPMTRRSWRWIGIVLGVGIALSSSTPRAADEALLNGASVKSWAYQLQGPNGADLDLTPIPRS